MFKKLFQINSVIKNGVKTNCFLRHKSSLVEPLTNTSEQSNQFPRLANVTVQDRFIYLEVNNETNTNVFKYPSIWLRDNCQCPKCYHRDSKSRVINWIDLKYDLTPKRIEVSEKLIILNIDMCFGEPWYSSNLGCL